MGSIQLSSSSVFTGRQRRYGKLGLCLGETVAISGIDSATLTTATAATNALAIIDGAIEKVASMRSGLGAIDQLATALCLVIDGRIRTMAAAKSLLKMQITLQNLRT